MTIIVEGERSFWLGAPAVLVEESREMAWADAHIKSDPFLRWITGRFAETERPNLNGHIFPAQDMAAAADTLPNKPLNMLHFSNRIVGHFVAQQMITPGPTAAAGNDLVHSYIDALSAFYSYYFPDQLKEVEKAHANGRLAYCVDSETELLTAAGWKHWDELVEGEDILTLNTSTYLSEWRPLERLYTYRLDGEDVIRMEGMMHSSVTTPNHRWWVERRPHRRHLPTTWQWRTTETLTAETWVPRAAPHGDFPAVPKYEDALVELMGWMWTEGTDPGRGGVVIHQSHVVNGPLCDRIAAALTRLFGRPARVRDGGKWYTTQPPRMTRFHLCKEAADELRALGGKFPKPSFIKELTEAQLRLFVATSLSADGDRAASGQIGIKQLRIEGLRTFEMACALLGIPTNTSSCKDGMWRTCLVRRSTRINPIATANKRKGFTIDRGPHRGVVWCPSTSNGTFLARRRGTVYWTGNSMEAYPDSLTCPIEGCGVEALYDGRQSPAYCGHMNKAGAPKRLNRSNFIGGALIIPPASPAWTGADITDLRAMMEEHELEMAAVYQQVASQFPHLDVASAEMLTAQVVQLAEREMGDAEQAVLYAAKYNMADRMRLAKEHKALPDGSYPVDNLTDLKSAIILCQSGHGDVAAAKKLIIRRAKDLSGEALLPADWRPKAIAAGRIRRPYRASALVAAGLCVKAADTGRVLMLQRSIGDDTDPAAGTWEFPGGHIEPGEDPFDAARREWEEETGSVLPAGEQRGSWTSPNGVYQGFIYVVRGEADVRTNMDLGDRHVLNPDDPDGDLIEVVAWWNVDDLIDMPALRPECMTTDWAAIEAASVDVLAPAGMG